MNDSDKFNASYNQDLTDSTAKKLRNFLAKKDKNINWQQSDELKNIYSSIKPRPNRANFAAIEKILKNLEAKKATLSDTHNLGVIVETRKHPYLEKVILNFIQHTGLKVQLFHGTENLEYILSGELRSYISSGQISLTELNADKLIATEYNALLLCREFWNAINGRQKIFIFQTDSWICNNSSFLLSDFINFDYIGSAWPRRRPIGLVIDGGSGGLSLRDWSKSFQCLDLFPAYLWKGGEDAFFAFHIELIGGEVGKIDDCGKFSSQYFFLEKSYAAHKLSMLPESQQIKFIQYCPQAEFLFNPQSTGND